MQILYTHSQKNTQSISDPPNVNKAFSMKQLWPTGYFLFLGSFPHTYTYAHSDIVIGKIFHRRLFKKAAANAACQGQYFWKET